MVMTMMMKYIIVLYCSERSSFIFRNKRVSYRRQTARWSSSIFITWSCIIFET